MKHIIWIVLISSFLLGLEACSSMLNMSKQDMPKREKAFVQAVTDYAKTPCQDQRSYNICRYDAIQYRPRLIMKALQYSYDIHHWVVQISAINEDRILFIIPNTMVQLVALQFPKNINQIKNMDTLYINGIFVPQSGYYQDIGTSKQSGAANDNTFNFSRTIINPVFRISISKIEKKS